MLDVLVTKQDIFLDLLGGFLSTYGVSPLLLSGFLGFGWIRWVSLLLPATSEFNSFIQLSLDEIVGGGRDDTDTYSILISPDSITTTFEIQQAGSVSYRMIALHLV